MEFWLLVIGIVVLYLGYPYIRCFVKRLSLRSKVKIKCQEKGYSLQGTHRFWFLGDKHGRGCDCYIETKKELIAIKLFSIPRHRRVLFFTENGEFFVRRFVSFFPFTVYSFNRRAEALPAYDFCYKCRHAEDNKPLRKMLLVNPVPMDIRMQEKRQEEYILNPGDMVNGMELMNLSELLKELEK